MFGDVNFHAVGIAAVLAFALGALWYSAVLFAKPWMAGLGYTEERFKEMQAGMGATYAISFLCWLVMATVLASIAPHFGDGVGATLHMGLMLWLGFGATVGLTNNRFSGTPIVVWIIDAGYQASRSRSWRWCSGSGRRSGPGPSRSQVFSSALRLLLRRLVCAGATQDVQ